jgi:hypothetical protein
MGVLRSPEGQEEPPSVLEGTKYLPSLHNVVWTESDQIDQLPQAEQRALDKGSQLAIRRARISVEILKRPSDNQTKFDLFQRLNAGGTQANAQELRNCIMLMVNEAGFRLIRDAAENAMFLAITGIGEEQMERQRHLEFAVRFLVLTNVSYDGILDVEEYIDEGIVSLIGSSKLRRAVKVMNETFSLLHDAAGANALKRYDGRRHIGKVGLVGLEGIAVGVGKNLSAIKQLVEPVEFLRERIQEFWGNPRTDSFSLS